MTSAGVHAEPGPVEDSAMGAFARWCAGRGAPVPADGTDYHALWRWSVDDLAGFWSAVRDFYRVPTAGTAAAVVTGSMPQARWFDGTRLNYVESVFRDRPPEGAALIGVGEDAEDRVLSWAELAEQVAAVAATLRAEGVTRGDRVVGYLPDVVEAVVAFLACAGIGAIWSSCGQDYSPDAAASRFAQLRPTVLVTADGYRFAGRDRDRREEVARLVAQLPTLRAVYLVPRLGSGPVEGCLPWSAAVAPRAEPAWERVPFDHPLWVLFSSGTTGTPKGIVHGHGGVLLEHLKSIGLHVDLGPTDRFAWYTTPSWMVWNYRNSALLLGTTVVCYDGSATSPSPDRLWALAARLGITFLGASPGYLAASESAGLLPGTDHDLGALRTVGSSGAPLPAGAYDWAADHVGKHVEVQSSSGGTDVVSAFAGGAPLLPVVPGELSGPCLGVALDAWDADGRPVRGETGELVVTRPMPSMPLHFWDDHDGSRYRETYFSTYPGAWRHGDWITITDHGSVLVSGRSDSTLNRHGVRIGSAEIYHAVEALPTVAEALVVGAEQSGGEYWMPLFVRLAGDATLTEDLAEEIRSAIREKASPRHVPDDIVAVDAVPHTITGKKLEVPVKRILQGVEVARAADPGAVDAPALLERFARYRTERSERAGRVREHHVRTT
ncbi:acetoacetyl-CoA synthetase [Pseudonocardia ammonioxydans]|uniref:Acetoacetyl-CoA synthetase n=1 Tax=Pseudonocardia ammonioxydans TaxID=260086 RepID=A0A1I5HPD9_PSUAM|nr:acetoacetate--CoA ligase [Pseudonocardia ammonioxydans]SFO50152.1 acetoacetyl-CoA synthetase [Pseudonocardia ammonioxydans]